MLPSAAFWPKAEAAAAEKRQQAATREEAVARVQHKRDKLLADGPWTTDERGGRTTATMGPIEGRPQTRRNGFRIERMSGFVVVLLRSGSAGRAVSTEKAPRVANEHNR